jgi:hypothetical protein
VSGSSSPGCVLEVVVIRLDAPQEKRFPKSYGHSNFFGKERKF